MSSSKAYSFLVIPIGRLMDFFPHLRRRRGFTLIEMLIVLAIISVLMALLMPALRNAREMGRRSVCLSNLKQIGVGTQIYVTDNGDYFPPYTGGAGSGGGDATRRLLSNAIGLTTNHPSSNVGDPVWKEKSVFHCPSAALMPLVTSSGVAGRELGGEYGSATSTDSYTYNEVLRGRFNGTDASGVSISTNLSVISNNRDLARIIWAADGVNQGMQETFIATFRHGGKDNWNGTIITAASSGLVRKRGGSGFNACFVDGHAEWVTWVRMIDWIYGPDGVSTGTDNFSEQQPFHRIGF